MTTTTYPVVPVPTGTTVASGGKINFNSGATLDMESGSNFQLAGTSVTSNAAELNYLDGIGDWRAKLPGTHVFTIGGEAGNVINVGIQLNTLAGVASAVTQIVYIYLSDSAVGDGLTSTAPSGGSAIGTDGTLLEALTANKSWMVLSESDGDIDINITEAGAATWYMVISDGWNMIVSGAITFA